MRVAATDYDGTLCMQRRVPPEALEAIAVWRNMGNMFGIVTGRDLSMLLPEVRQWGIPFDYLICCSGAVSYDKDLRPLDTVSIEDGLIAPVLRHPSSLASMHYELCAHGEVRLFLRDEASWFPKLGTPYTPVTLDEAMAQTGLQQISIAYHSLEDGAAHAADLDKAFGDALWVHHNGSCVDITAGNVSKATGMDRLLRRMGWPREGLLFIGDGENDIPMIREYAGFTVPGAPEAVRREAAAVYAGVGPMLRDAMG